MLKCIFENLTKPHILGTQKTLENLRLKSYQNIPKCTFEVIRLPHVKNTRSKRAETHSKIRQTRERTTHQNLLCILNPKLALKICDIKRNAIFRLGFLPDKSSKHRKAEGLIAKGQAIRILRESDFKELVNQAEDIT